MKILLIDNNDSFTYNLVDLFRRAKADYRVVPSPELSIRELDEYSHIVISPGPMLPKDFPILKDVIAYSLHNNKPLLGVCLGFQAIGEYFGGTLSRLDKVTHGQKHSIKTTGESKLYAGLPQEIEVGLYHSWCLQNIEHTPLKITALNASNTIMSIEHEKAPIYGIQYHLESFLCHAGQAILHNFLSIE